MFTIDKCFSGMIRACFCIMSTNTAARRAFRAIIPAHPAATFPPPFFVPLAPSEKPFPGASFPPCYNLPPPPRAPFERGFFRVKKGGTISTATPSQSAPPRKPPQIYRNGAFVPLSDKIPPAHRKTPARRLFARFKGISRAPAPARIIYPRNIPPDNIKGYTPPDYINIYICFLWECVKGWNNNLIKTRHPRTPVILLNF